MKKDRVPELHFYEWSVPRWVLSTTRDQLDATGRGIYRDLLDLCYTQGGFLFDLDLLCRKCACTKEQFSAVWPNIQRHFPRDRHDTTKCVNNDATTYRKNYFDYIAGQRAKRKSKNPEREVSQNQQDVDQWSSREKTKENFDNSRINSGSTHNTIQDNTIQDEKEKPFVPESGDGVSPSEQLDLIPATPVTEKTVRAKADPVIESLAITLCSRHPKPRTCYPGEAVAKLKKIFSLFPKSEWSQLAERIDAKHSAECRSQGWQKDGGEYAKGLTNWLDPKVREKWAVQSGAPASAEPTMVYVIDTRQPGYRDPRWMKLARPLPAGVIEVTSQEATRQ